MQRLCHNVSEHESSRHVLNYNLLSTNVVMNEKNANFDMMCPLTCRPAFVCEEYSGLIVLIEHNRTNL